jgi:uncharacterized RDD family membrane protein YckC
MTGALERGTEYGGLITRAIAFAIDAAIVNAAAVVVGVAVGLILSVLPGRQELGEFDAILAGVAFAAWCIAYWATFWATTGQTPGSRVMRIRVTRPDGSALRGGRATLRVGATVLAALPLLAGFVPILLNRRRRGLHDWLADTVVTRAPPAVSVSARAVVGRRAGHPVS